MCTGAEAPAIIAAISAAGGAVATNQSQRDQDKLAAAGIMRQASLGRQADNAVTKNISQLETSSPDAEKAAANQNFMTALREASKHDGIDFGTTGAVSDRFAGESNLARKAVANKGASLADSYASIDAPINQRIHEGEGRADVASQLSMLGKQSANENFLTQLRVANTRPNPWVMAASELGQGYGAAKAKMPPKVKGAKLGMAMDSPQLLEGLV